MSSDVEKIKERLGIVEVVSGYVNLEKAGSNLKARCPFHNEKTPSFLVSPTRNTFYCFGCGAKGDIFSFVEQFEGLDFPGALAILAQRAGVTLQRRGKGDRDERAKLYEILEVATIFFEQNLEGNTAVLKYIVARGVKGKTKNAFRLGYARAEWRSLYDYLTKKGYTEKDIEAVGLIKRSENRVYDRFRDRIMFPITDASGRVTAYSGRIFSSDDEKTAKYINSPETPLFNKSRTLYGFDKAKFGIRKLNAAIVVEGQFDLLMAHQVGFINTVALSGTALTRDHITMIGRLSQNIVLAFDADPAGHTSAGKSAELALSSGMDVKVAAIPKGVDPADLAKADSGELKRVIRESAHIIDFYLSSLRENIQEKRAYGKAVQREVLPFVARIKSKIDQAHFIGEVAKALGVSQDTISTELENIPDLQEVVSVRNEPKKNTEIKPGRKEAIERRLFGIILWQKSLTKPDIDLAALERSIVSIIGETKLQQLQERPEVVSEEILFTTESGYSSKKELERDIEELLQALEEEYIKSSYEEALSELREAEALKNEALVAQKLVHCKELSERLQKLQTISE